jgi:hypothetical protein
MELKNLYEQYRNGQLTFINEKIIPSLDNEVIMDSAIALDMIDKKGKIIYEDESSINYLLDFAIYEHKIEGKNIIERYVENHEPENAIEEVVISTLLKSFTSLFRVVNISPTKNMIFLKDTFNQIKNLRLIDVASSQTLDTSTLVFARILPFPELNMTSGAPFVFSDDMEIRLTGDYKRITENMIRDTTTNKFVWFYNANKHHGLAVDFQHTHSHHEHHHEHHHHDHDCCCGHDH